MSSGIVKLVSSVGSPAYQAFKHARARCFSSPFPLFIFCSRSRIKTANSRSSSSFFVASLELNGAGGGLSHEYFGSALVVSSGAM